VLGDHLVENLDRELGLILRRVGLREQEKEIQILDVPGPRDRVLQHRQRPVRVPGAEEVARAGLHHVGIFVPQ